MNLNKAVTLQEKFGFKDEELSTPAHDAIMFWLDQSIEELLQKRENKTDWTDEQIAEVDTARREYYKGLKLHASNQARWESDSFKAAQWQAKLDTLAEYPALVLPPFEKMKLHKKIWEHPVMTATRFSVGFIDLLVETSLPSIGIREQTLECALTWYAGETYAFEVKPVIRSAGETIRQIRLYQQHMRDTTFVIVCPNDKFRSIFEGQGIKFMKCPAVEELL